MRVTAFDSLHVAVMIQSKPSAVNGSARMKSIVIVWNGLAGVRIGCSDPYG